MGFVFEAEDTQLRRLVALKLMLPRGTADAHNRARFLREAQSAASLSHDNVVPVFQVGESNGVPFITMPLLRGESLQKRLDRSGALPVADLLQVAREVAAGLAAAHARGVVHRDIKPDNLWLETSEDGKSGTFRVKILDFGLARAVDDDTNLTNPGGVVGTPPYMAPEQALGQDVDSRADLFSLGAILYAASTTGRSPFRRKDTLSTLYAVCHDTPTPLHDLKSEIPHSLSELIMRLLEKTPANRLSARDVVATISEIGESFRPARQRESAPQVAFQQTRSETEHLEHKSPVSESWLSPTTLRKAPPPHSQNRVLVGLLLGFFGLLLAAGPVVYSLRTDKGEILIRTDDPTLTVTVKKDGAVIEDPARKRVYKVAPGQYEVIVTDENGDTITTKSFTLTRGGKEILAITVPPVPSGTPGTGVGGTPAVTVPKTAFGFQRELFTDTELKKPVADSKTLDAVMQWGWGWERPVGITSGAAFSARWSGFIKVPKQSEYDFRFVASGGLRVFINDKSIVNSWDDARTDFTRKIALPDTPVEVKIEFRTGTGRADFAWLWLDKAWGGERPVPTSILFPDRDTAVRTKLRDDPVQSDEIERQGPDAPANATAFSGNGRLMAWVQDYPSGLIMPRDTVEKHPERLNAERGVADIAFAPDGSLLVAGCKDGTVLVWETKTWAIRNKLEHAKAVKQVSFAPNGKWFATVGIDGTVLVWDAASCKQTAELPKVVPLAIGWADSGNQLLTLGVDGIPRAWNSTTGKKETEYPAAGNADTTAATFTADGKAVLVAAFQKKTATGMLQWIELATGHNLGSAPLAAPAGKVAVSPDGRWAATGVSRDWWLTDAKHTAYDALTLFEISTDRKLREVCRFAGHTKWVETLVFSADSKKLASGSTDRSWRLWLLPENAKNR
jgi:serine/threonine protein kinase/WD40 repeat protein